MKIDLLEKPFEEKDIEWRLQSCGEKNGKFWAKALAYINARAVMNRLDTVCGKDNWQDKYIEIKNGFICSIGIKINNDEWVWKTDGAERTAFEELKGGMSDAFKRAAVKWGIGRYLYYLDTTFAKITPNGKYSGKTKDNKYFRWDPPELPTWVDKLKDKFKGEEI